MKDSAASNSHTQGAAWIGPGFGSTPGTRSAGVAPLQTEASDPDSTPIIAFPGVLSIRVAGNSSRISALFRFDGSKALFSVRNAANGTWATLITNVQAAGLEWDGNTPPNSYVK